MAFEVFEDVAGWREVVIEKTACDKLRVIADKREDVVYGAAEIGGDLFDADKEIPSVSARIQAVFEKIMRIAESDEENVPFAGGKPITPGEQLEPDCNAAIRGWLKARDRFCEPCNGGANAGPDFRLRTIPHIVEEVAWRVAEIDFKNSATNDIAVGIAGTFERVLVPFEVVVANDSLKRSEVVLQVASRDEDGYCAEKVASARDGCRTSVKEVVQEAQRLLRLELEGGMSRVDGGLGFHFWGSPCW